MLLFCSGALFLAHNDGGDLFNGFHQVMFPGLTLLALVHYQCETSHGNDTFSALKLFRGLWGTILGSWFMNIGYGYFWDHGIGYLGNSNDNVGPLKAWGTLVGID